MKPLNQSAITAGYLRFLSNFCLLLLSLVVIICAFFSAVGRHSALVSADRIRYERILFGQRLLKQKMDSVYADLSLMNTGLVRSDQLLATRVLQQKNKLDTILRVRLRQSPREVYRKLAAQLPEMLALKDSITHRTEQILAIQHELSDCQLHERQRK